MCTATRARHGLGTGSVMLVGVVPAQAVQLASFLLRGAPASLLAHGDGDVDAGTLGGAIVVRGARLWVGHALIQQQHDAEDPVEALDPQASDAASRTRGRTPADPARDARGPGGVEPSGVGDVRPGFDAIVATDGACSGNPGPGGWAWVEQITGARDSGGAARTTNNAMELTALVRALEYVGPSGDLLSRADSQYASNTMTKWAPSWRRKGWKKADGKPVANRELVERLLTLYEARIGRTEVEWVRGHTGDAANELADALAVARSREFL